MRIGSFFTGTGGLDMATEAAAAITHALVIFRDLEAAA